MRLLILAVGHSRGTSEGALCDDFVGRAKTFGKRLGFSSVAAEEVAVSKSRETKKRIAEEGERLANEKEVLGFFVSGHPLDKYAEKLRNLTGVITVAEALERKPPERRRGGQTDMADELQVAGIMHGLRVQKSRRDQRLYAQATLEDATGKMELICFARDYEKLAEQLKIEAPVLVRGTLMGDEDAAPKIAVSQVQPLEEVQVKLPGGVRIRINLDRATEDILSQLKSAAEAAPGPGKVMLQLEKKGEYAVILEPEGMSVAADRGWVERIEELAGKGSVQAVS